jgi:hypothetical protein
MIVISQPRYLPALTYLQRLWFSDTFVILDNVQRQKRGFENRNRVLVNGKTKWLTIPSKSSSRALIQDTTINGSGWIGDHKKKLEQYYSEAPFYNGEYIEQYFGNLENEIEVQSYDFSTSLIYLIKNACSIFDFEPNLVRASELKSSEVKDADGPDKIFEISKALEEDLYISGMNGREYGIKDSFAGSGIDVKFHEDEPEPYDQNIEEFIPHLAFFDALFYAGYDFTDDQIKKEPDLKR